MPESDRRVQETIDQLNQQLDQLGEVDPKVRAILEHAIDDLRDKLKAKGESQPPAAMEGAAGGESESTSSDEANDASPAPATHESIVERLRHAAESFEHSHPQLSTSIGSVISALSEMGI